MSTVFVRFFESAIAEKVTTFCAALELFRVYAVECISSEFPAIILHQNGSANGKSIFEARAKLFADTPAHLGAVGAAILLLDAFARRHPPHWYTDSRR